MRYRRQIGRIAMAVTATVAGMALIVSAGPADAVTMRLSQTFTGTATGTVTRSFGMMDNAVPILTGYDLRFTGDDHSIGEIWIYSTQHMAVTFADKDSDDEYTYTVARTWMKIDGALYPPVLHANCGGGSCTYDIYRPPTGAYFPVIVGFYFGFDGNGAVPSDCTDDCDHSLGDIGIEFGNGTVTATYADKNRDDNYTFVLDYVLVPLSHVPSGKTLRGTVSDTGHFQQDLPATTGIRGIGGFRFHYVDYYAPIPGQLPMLVHPNEHLKRFALKLTGNQLSAYLKDKDASNSHPVSFMVKSLIIE